MRPLEALCFCAVVEFLNVASFLIIIFIKTTLYRGHCLWHGFG
jgi:hypothetical protein